MWGSGQNANVSRGTLGEVGWHLILVMLVLLFAQQPHIHLCDAFGFVFLYFLATFHARILVHSREEAETGSGNSVFEPLDCQEVTHLQNSAQKVSKTTVWKALVAFLFSFCWELEGRTSFSPKGKLSDSRTTHVIWRLEVKLWFGVWQWLGGKLDLWTFRGCY